jgi:hypothetical protein
VCSVHEKEQSCMHKSPHRDLVLQSGVTSSNSTRLQKYWQKWKVGYHFPPPSDSQVLAIKQEEKGPCVATARQISLDCDPRQWRVAFQKCPPPHWDGHRPEAARRTTPRRDYRRSLPASSFCSYRYLHQKIVTTRARAKGECLLGAGQTLKNFSFSP